MEKMVDILHLLLIEEIMEDHQNIMEESSSIKSIEEKKVTFLVLTKNLHPPTEDITEEKNTTEENM